MLFYLPVSTGQKDGAQQKEHSQDQQDPLASCGTWSIHAHSQEVHFIINLLFRCWTHRKQREVSGIFVKYTQIKVLNHSYCGRYEFFMHNFITLGCNRFHIVFSLWVSQYSFPTVHYFFITVQHSYLNICGKKTGFPSPLCSCSHFCSPAKRLINLICKCPFSRISSKPRRRRLISL